MPKLTGNLVEITGRLKYLLAVQFLTLAVVMYFNIGQFGVWFLKINLMSVGVLLGYGADREVFPYARPHDVALTYGVDSQAFAVASIRRAIVLSAAMIAAALAL